MPLRVQIDGDKTKACSYLGWAKSKLFMLKANMKLLNIKQDRRNYAVSGARIFISSIFDDDLVRIVGEGGVYIICIHGSTTRIHDGRKYYLLVGNTLQETSKPHIIDDGKYVPYTNPATFNIDTFYEDPNSYLYRYEGDGIGVASVANGKAAKVNNRIILNEAIEDELWHMITVELGYYTYSYLRHFDSLMYLFYNLYARPFVSRYVSDGIITMHHQWNGSDDSGVLQLHVYGSTVYQDMLPKVKNIYKTKFDKTRLTTPVNGGYALLCAANYSNDKTLQRLIRGNTFNIGDNLYSEPMKEETYNVDTRTFISEGTNHHRCISGNECHQYQYSDDFSTIKNDVKAIYDIDGDGKLTYIRIEKDNPITQTKLSLYVADKLIETSGWEAVNKILASDTYGPYYLWKTRYKIIHCHQDANFKVALFRKTKYVSYASELMDYVWQNAGHYYYMRLNALTTKTTYHIAVNGKVSDLDYSADNEERWITGTNEEKLNPPYNEVLDWLQYLPACDSLGDNITRVFSSAIKNKLLIAFDIFPVDTNHDIIWNEYQNLILKENSSPFPPRSDLKDITDRKWLLFDTAGGYAELTVPKKNSGDNVNRINGLALMEVG